MNTVFFFCLLLWKTCSAQLKKKRTMNKSMGGDKVLTRKQFEVLEILAIAEAILTQRELEKITNYSLGTINKVMKELTELGFVAEGVITNDGLNALEPYRAKRAIFIAAGFGSRMVPITFNTPKPLVRVHGKRIIDSLIDACLEAGIDEVYIVRGYLAEQFDQLLYKYPMIKFLENPAYNEANNISSAMCTRYLLKNAYVCEADLLVMNPKLIKKYQYSSNFLGIPVERTDDWCFEVKGDFIQKQKVGGEQKSAEDTVRLYQEVGISYWSEADGSRLAEHIKQAFEMPGGKERYWDQVPFVVFPNEYKVEIRECQFEDIVEIDTFRELKEIDKVYDV